MDLPKERESRPRKHFFEEFFRLPETVANLPLVIAPSSGAIADAILQECISPRRASLARSSNPRGVDGASAALSRIL